MLFDRPAQSRPHRRRIRGDIEVAGGRAASRAIGVRSHAGGFHRVLSTRHRSGTPRGRFREAVKRSLLVLSDDRTRKARRCLYFGRGSPTIESPRELLNHRCARRQMVAICEVPRRTGISGAVPGQHGTTAPYRAAPAGTPCTITAEDRWPCSPARSRSTGSGPLPDRRADLRILARHVVDAEAPLSPCPEGQRQGFKLRQSSGKGTNRSQQTVLHTQR